MSTPITLSAASLKQTVSTKKNRVSAPLKKTSPKAKVIDFGNGEYSQLQEKLYQLGFIDEFCQINQEAFLDQNGHVKPLPKISEKQYQALNDILCKTQYLVAKDGSYTLPYNITDVPNLVNQYLYQKNNKAANFIFVGGIVKKILGFSFYKDALKSLGIKNLESLLPEGIDQEYSKMPQDIDVRIYSKNLSCKALKQDLPKVIIAFFANKLMEQNHLLNSKQAKEEIYKNAFVNFCSVCYGKNHFKILSTRDANGQEVDHLLVQQLARKYLFSRDAQSLYLFFQNSQMPTLQIQDPLIHWQSIISRITKANLIPNIETVDHNGWIMFISLITRNETFPESGCENILRNSLTRYLQQFDFPLDKLSSLMIKAIKDHHEADSNSAAIYLINANMYLKNHYTNTELKQLYKKVLECYPPESEERSWIDMLREALLAPAICCKTFNAHLFLITKVNQMSPSVDHHISSCKKRHAGSLKTQLKIFNKKNCYTIIFHEDFKDQKHYLDYQDKTLQSLYESVIPSTKTSELQPFIVSVKHGRALKKEDNHAKIISSFLLFNEIVNQKDENLLFHIFDDARLFKLVFFHLEGFFKALHLAYPDRKLLFLNKLKEEKDKLQIQGAFLFFLFYLVQEESVDPILKRLDIKKIGIKYYELIISKMLEIPMPMSQDFLDVLYDASEKKCISLLSVEKIYSQINFSDQNLIQECQKEVYKLTTMLLEKQEVIEDERVIENIEVFLRQLIKRPLNLKIEALLKLYLKSHVKRDLLIKKALFGKIFYHLLKQNKSHSSELVSTCHAFLQMDHDFSTPLNRGICKTLIKFSERLFYENNQKEFEKICLFLKKSKIASDLKLPVHAILTIYQDGLIEAKSSPVNPKEVQALESFKMNLKKQLWKKALFSLQNVPQNTREKLQKQLILAMPLEKTLSDKEKQVRLEIIEGMTRQFQVPLTVDNSIIDFLKSEQPPFQTSFQNLFKYLISKVTKTPKELQKQIQVASLAEISLEILLLKAAKRKFLNKTDLASLPALIAPLVEKKEFSLGLSLLIQLHCKSLIKESSYVNQEEICSLIVNCEKQEKFSQIKQLIQSYLGKNRLLTEESEQKLNEFCFKAIQFFIKKRQLTEISIWISYIQNEAFKSNAITTVLNDLLKMSHLKDDTQHLYSILCQGHEIAKNPSVTTLINQWFKEAIQTLDKHEWIAHIVKLNSLSINFTPELITTLVKTTSEKGSIDEKKLVWDIFRSYQRLLQKKWQLWEKCWLSIYPIFEAISLNKRMEIFELLNGEFSYIPIISKEIFITLLLTASHSLIKKSAGNSTCKKILKLLNSKRLKEALKDSPEEIISIQLNLCSNLFQSESTSIKSLGITIFSEISKSIEKNGLSNRYLSSLDYLMIVMTKNRSITELEMLSLLQLSSKMTDQENCLKVNIMPLITHGLSAEYKNVILFAENYVIKNIEVFTSALLNKIDLLISNQISFSSKKEKIQQFMSAEIQNTCTVMLKHDYFYFVAKIILENDLSDLIDKSVLLNLKETLMDRVLTTASEKSSEIEELKAGINFYVRYAQNLPANANTKEYFKKTLLITTKILLKHNNLPQFKESMQAIVRFCQKRPNELALFFIKELIEIAKKNQHLEFKKVALDCFEVNFLFMDLPDNEKNELKKDLLGIIFNLMIQHNDSKLFIQYLKEFFVCWTKTRLEIEQNFDTLIDQIMKAIKNNTNILNPRLLQPSHVSIAASHHAKCEETSCLFIEVIEKLSCIQTTNRHHRYLFLNLAYTIAEKLFINTMLLKKPVLGREVFAMILKKMIFSKKPFEDPVFLSIHLKRAKRFLNLSQASKNFHLDSRLTLQMLCFLPSNQHTEMLLQYPKKEVTLVLKSHFQYLKELPGFHTFMHMLHMFVETLPVIKAYSPDKAEEIFRMILVSLKENPMEKMEISETLKALKKDLLIKKSIDQSLYQDLFEHLNAFEKQNLDCFKLKLAIEIFKSNQFRFYSSEEPIAINLTGKMSLELMDTVLSIIETCDQQYFTEGFEFVLSLLWQYLNTHTFNQEQIILFMQVIEKIKALFDQKELPNREHWEEQIYLLQESFSLYFEDFTLEMFSELRGAL